MYVGGAAVLTVARPLVTFGLCWFSADGQWVQSSVRCGTSLVGVSVRKGETVALLLEIFLSCLRESGF